MCLTEKRHTIQTGVVRLNEGLLDLSILDEENVALAAVIAEDGAALEAEVERLGELAGGVTQEADLFKIQCQLCAGIKKQQKQSKKDLHRSCRRDRGNQPKPWSYMIALSTNVPTLPRLTRH
jgi:hypothetical protein